MRMMPGFIASAEAVWPSRSALLRAFSWREYLFVSGGDMPNQAA